MASLRDIKKDIDYLVSEVIYDCYLTIYFHPEKKEEVVAILGEATQLHNNLMEMANNPAEKHNKSLVKKHYAFLRREMMEKVDGLFSKLSDITKNAA